MASFVFPGSARIAADIRSIVRPPAGNRTRRRAWPTPLATARSTRTATAVARAVERESRRHAASSARSVSSAPPGNPITSPRRACASRTLIRITSSPMRSLKKRTVGTAVPAPISTTATRPARASQPRSASCCAS
ncbi:hypothetical protein WT08_10900 [Burkholderia sp. MSMB1552]|nr:hypothetical protein WT08_10900 [Burkholderia sp. MSMB1552]KWZ56668.1 hypothetical protein WS92_12735 [Burkholderia sp. MSMB1588]